MKYAPGRLLLSLFVFSESFFFVALIIAYVYYRNFTGATDTVAANLDPLKTGVFTLFLLGSSATAVVAERRLRRNDWRGYRVALAATVGLATVFLYGQAREYAGLYRKQITLSADVFGSSFFTLTGFHALHVLLGLIGLTVFLGLGRGAGRPLAAAGFGPMSLYWHFVDAVWVAVFFFVYLMPLL